MPTDTAVTIPGYSWDESTKLCQLIQKPDKNSPGETFDEWQPIVPFNVVPICALRDGDHITHVRADVVMLDGRMLRVTLPASMIFASRPAQVLHDSTGLQISHKEAGALGLFLEVIVTEQAHGLPEEKLRRTAEWENDYLVIPEGSKFGEVAEDTTDLAAHVAWHEVINHGNNNPRLALFIGAGFIAPFLQFFKTDISGFTAHLYGDANNGKTQTLKTAVAVWGEPTPNKLLSDWNGTENALKGRLRDAGILPVVLDDTSVLYEAGSRDANRLIESFVYAASGGSDKDRMNADASLKEAETFSTVALSTGEHPVIDQGRTGLLSRVIDIPVPAVSDANLQRRIMELAEDNYGWPTRWLVQSRLELDLNRGRLPDEFRYVEHGDSLERAATNVGLAAMGWELLAQVCMFPAPPKAAELGRTVFDEMAARYRDLGTSSADRLWDALPAFILQNQSRIEGLGSHADVGGNVIGKKQGHDYMLTVPAVRELAEELGLGSPETALRGLRDAHKLHASPGALTTSTRISKLSTKVYRFVNLAVSTEVETEADTAPEKAFTGPGF